MASARKTSLLTLLALGLLGTAGQAMAERTYEITITNLTKAQSFTPILGVAHRASISLFETGQPASEPLAMMAEGGDTGPLADVVANSPKAGNSFGTDGLLGPGESTTVVFENSYQYKRLSVVAMLIPTNDSFFGINNVWLPNRSATYFGNAYDSGSEVNDEMCASIPGPTCGGEGFSADDGEGFVHIANGVSGEGELSSGTYDWNGPVVRVDIRRINNDE